MSLTEAQYNATPPTLTDKQLSLLQVDSTGALKTTGGGGGGAVTIADGAAVTIGAVADSAYAGSGTASLVAAAKGIYAVCAAATPAGTNIIGKVGIDQTTPGTTNAVSATGNVASGASDSGNPVKVGGPFNTTQPTVTNGQRVDWQMTNRGEGKVAISNGGQSAIIIGTGQDGVSNAILNGLVTFGYNSLFNGSTWDRQKKPSSTSRIPSSAATTNGTSAKASAGDVFHIRASNTTASVKYLKFYNKASAPTVGTDTPTHTFAIPPSNAAFDVSFPNGMYFSTGIAYALTGAAADADTTALASGDVVGLTISYQ